MSIWQILGRLAVSDEGKTIQQISDTTSLSSDGTTYTRMGSTTVGSDGSMFTQMGSFSSDGSTRMGSSATGLGAVFNKQDDWPSSKADKFGVDDDNW
jgi:hypothetical protein